MSANFAQGEDDWLRLIMGNQGRGPTMPPMPGMPPVSPQTMEAPQAQLGGQPPPAPSGLRGLLGNRDLALALLANSGYGPKQSFGQVLGKSALMADQMGQQRNEDAFKRQYMQAQMHAMQNKGQGQPSSVQEYEYARQNGYKGSFQEWTTAAGQTSRPSSVQEWEFYNALPPEQKRLYLEMKRNPNFKVAEIGGGQTVVTGLPGGGVQTTALSTPQQEVAFAAQKKGAESQAGAVGAGQGAIIAGIQKKGADAKTVMSTLDLADSLVDKATGSAVGTGVDKTAGFFGKSTEGAQAIAQLQVLQAGLMLNMPRMEGPQSDRDVELYRQAAASLGDPTVPRETKKAAIATIRNIQRQYQDRANQPIKDIFPRGSQEANQEEVGRFNSLLDKYAPAK